MAQNARERTVSQLKSNRIDILVATDVAARGLDVERVSHVINYDMPPKADPYIHRIGRTGRAGRSGEAILFVSRNERWMIKVLEKATRQPIKKICLPSNKAINNRRVASFHQAMSQACGAESQNLDMFEKMILQHADKENLAVSKVAAALACIVHGNTPFLLPDDVPLKAKAKKNLLPPEKGMERYRIEVGRSHGVRARDIVGAISSEAGLKGTYIKGITIHTEFTLVDLPAGMPAEIFQLLKKTWVRSRPMAISRYT
jgi:ATP-dependent RNA helicase DeaD